MSFPIETPRLRLRLPSPEDADFIIELVNDPAWLRYIGDRHVRNRAAAEAYVAKCHAMYAAHGVCLHVAELRATGEATGLCGLLQRVQFRDLDLGYAFLERFRGQGIAQEAALAMLRFGHDTLRRERILALTDPANAASIGLLRKLGFTHESSVARPDGTTESEVFVHVEPLPRDTASGRT